MIHFYILESQNGRSVGRKFILSEANKLAKLWKKTIILSKYCCCEKDKLWWMHFKMQPREGGFYNTLQILCLSSRMFGCFSQSVEVTGSLLASSDLFKNFKTNFFYFIFSFSWFSFKSFVYFPFFPLHGLNPFFLQAFFGPLQHGLLPVSMATADLFSRTCSDSPRPGRPCPVLMADDKLT